MAHVAFGGAGRPAREIDTQILAKSGLSEALHNTNPRAGPSPAAVEVLEYGPTLQGCLSQCLLIVVMLQGCTHVMRH